MIRKLAHAAYTVRDMQATLRFYCQGLGLSHAFSLSRDDGSPWIEYVKVADGQFIEFFYPEAGSEDSRGSFMHLCLEVDDIHQTAAALKASGIVLRVPPTRGKDSNWQCWADDPDGNPIEFMQIDPASPQANA